jgi:hypothetical protein
LNYMSSVWMALFLIGGAVMMGSAKVDPRLVGDGADRLCRRRAGAAADDRARPVPGRLRRPVLGPAVGDGRICRSRRWGASASPSTAWCSISRSAAIVGRHAVDAGHRRPCAHLARRRPAAGHRRDGHRGADDDDARPTRSAAR